MKKLISIREIKDTLATWKFWKELFIMTFGMLIAAIAVNYFLVPSKIIVGSITGLSIVLTKLFALAGLNIKLSVVIFTINAILLLLAYFLIGKEFGTKTVYTALILAPLMELCDAVYPFSAYEAATGNTSMMGDPWFDLICFILLLSLSQAMLFHINASTGGLDILAKIVNKYLHFPIGTSVTIAGAMIVCTSFAINPVRLVIIGLIGTWLNGIAVDYFTAGINKRKRVCIISEDSERIRKYIIDDLRRGCSLYEVTGGYSGEKMVEIQVLLSTNEYAGLLDFIDKNHIHAFTTAGNVSEVYGRWRSPDKKLI